MEKQPEKHQLKLCKVFLNGILNIIQRNYTYHRNQRQMFMKERANNHLCRTCVVMITGKIIFLKMEKTSNYTSSHGHNYMTQSNIDEIHSMN